LSRRGPIITVSMMGGGTVPQARPRMADRGLAQTEAQRRTGHASFLHDGVENDQEIEVDRAQVSGRSLPSGRTFVRRLIRTRHNHMPRMHFPSAALLTY
jgi:hypothetical protein